MVRVRATFPAVTLARRPRGHPAGYFVRPAMTTAVSPSYRLPEPRVILRA
jgi:hypothetical protein